MCAAFSSLLANRLRESSAPEEGRPLEEILDLVFSVASDAGHNTASGGYGGFFVGGGLLHTGVADLMSACINRFVGAFILAPGYVQLESNVINWMSQLVGYNTDEAFGCFTSGASMANFIGILVARRRHLQEEDLSKGAVMVTNQAHACIAKGLMMAGLPQSSACCVAADSQWRMDPVALEKEILACKERGQTPFLVVATAGTTNTGAVDSLRELAAICRQHGAWLHVDGAYGAAFNLTERGKQALDGLEEADSVAIDLHKSFFLPFATGIVVVKKRVHLRNAFRLDADAPYYPEFPDTDVNFHEMCPELSTSFRGLRIWLPLQMCGLKKWRHALDQRLDWAEEMCTALESISSMGVEVTTKPTLSLLTFRYVPSHLQASESDHPASTESLQQEINIASRRLLQFINARNRMCLTPTIMPCGMFVIRISILHLRLTKARLDALLEDIQDGIKELEKSFRS